MSQEKIKCPFCEMPAIRQEVFGTLDFMYRDCLCGEFVIPRIVEAGCLYNEILKDKEAKKLFSGYLRNNKTITITNDFVSNELKKILEYCQSIPLDEKISKIKNYIYHRTRFLGHKISINYDSLYTLFYLKNPDELKLLITYLVQTNMLQKNNVGEILLTIEGFAKIESELENETQSKKVFIACKFNTDYQDNLVKTIKSACRACGFDANLVSDERHNENISNKIISDIKKAKFIIADFTGQNSGVYFEAGYGMGMKKEVIRLIRKGDIDDLHFDTKQFNHIEWEENKWPELEEELKSQIDATIK